MRLALVRRNLCGSSNEGLKSVKEDDNVTLASKGKAKKGPSLGQGSQGGGEKKKKDLSKIKSFRCVEFGHYSTWCLQRKKDKQEKQGQETTSAEID